MSMRKIYRKIAREHGVSAKEVRQDIQGALTGAYTDPLNKNDVTRAYQKRVPSSGEIPTPEEFIRYATQRIRTENAVCRDMHTADQPIDDWIFWDLPFVFDCDQITASNPCPFRKLFLSQTTLDTGIFDSQTEMCLSFFH